MNQRELERRVRGQEQDDAAQETELALLKQRVEFIGRVAQNAAAASQGAAVNNLVENGNIDYSTNNHLYDVDTGTPNTNYEAAKIYHHPHDTMQEVFDAAINNGSNTVNCNTSAPFTAGMNGKTVGISGAGAGGAELTATFTYVSATQGTLSANAASTVAGARLRFNLQTILPDGHDNDPDANPATNSALKSSAHALYANDDPRWERNEGVISLGAARTLDFNLREKIEPGTQLILGFIARLAPGVALTALPAGLELRAGMYDSTPGQQRFIESQPFTVTGVADNGGGATTTREYLVVAEIAPDTLIFSNLLSVTAPAVFTQGRRVTLSWNLPRVPIFRVYRRTGATVTQLVQLNNQEQTFIDLGTGQTLPGGLPTGDRRVLRSVARIRDFDTKVTSAWNAYYMQLPFPSTYLHSLTETGKLWLRLWLTQSLGTPRALELDKVHLSTTGGVFAPSRFDGRHRGTVTSLAGSSQGGVGTSGGSFIPPYGEGDPRCIALDTSFVWRERHGKVTPTPARALEIGDVLIGANYTRAVVTNLETHPGQVFTLRAADGAELDCTVTHRIVRHSRDTGMGFCVSEAEENSTSVLTYARGVYNRSVVTAKDMSALRNTTVLQITLAAPHHTFLAGKSMRQAICNHNVKLLLA